MLWHASFGEVLIKLPDTATLRRDHTGSLGQQLSCGVHLHEEVDLFDVEFEAMLGGGRSAVDVAVATAARPKLENAAAALALGGVGVEAPVTSGAPSVASVDVSTGTAATSDRALAKRKADENNMVTE